MRHKHVLGALLLLCAAVMLPLAFAQSTSSTSTLPAWVIAAWQQALSVPVLPTILLGKVPATLPQTTTTVDLNGQTSTYFTTADVTNAEGVVTNSVTTSQHSFFQSLGTNGRTCFSCHQPQNNWSTTPATLLTTYVTTLGKDPVFAPIDGSDCPTTGAAANTFGLKFIEARVQLFTKGNFRIFLTAPTTPQWAFVSVTSDPTGCETGQFGIAGGGLSFYRRPLPATNVLYTSPGRRLNANGTPVPNIMWDTREPSLESQFNDATLTHAQAATPPTAAQIADGVAFQSGSFTAQSSMFVGGDLTGADGSGATGGPAALYNYSANLLPPAPGGGFGAPGCAIAVLPCPGSTIANPKGDPGFQELGAYATYNGGTTAAAQAMRASISRGEVIFNTRAFVVNGVTGLTDIGFGPPGAPPAASQVASCSTCHNNANVGNDSFNDPKHLGVGDNSYIDAAQSSPNLTTTLPMTPDQPVFTFLCPVGSINYFSNPVTGPDGNTYDEYQTSDPGVGWITGNCNDLGKFKVSSLRGIGARPPFFHGGQAATMTQVIQFYNNRFNIGLSAQDIIDLTNFMNAQ
jgi:cytochrome c peroxidase